MDWLVLTHLLALATWGGIVAVEVVIELSARTGRIPHTAAAELHKWIDRCVEVPVLTVVVGSGVALWARHGFALALLPKVAAGLAAVAANLVCVALVERRAARPEPERRFAGIAATLVVGGPAAGLAAWLGGRAAGWW